MRPTLLLALATLTLAAMLPAQPAWPSFRGVRGAGVAEGHKLPTRWYMDAGENIAWRTPIPGLGLSSPCVWGNKVFLTTAVAAKGKAELKAGLYGSVKSVPDEGVVAFEVLCLELGSGKVLWRRTAYKGKPKIKRHPKSSHANGTTCTDGKVLVAFFDSHGLYAYDLAGKLLWKRDFGVLDYGFFRMPDAQWGGGSSPVLHEGRVILQCDVQKGSFLAALDAKTGKTLWRTPRDEVPTWGTPMVCEHGGTTQVVVNGWKHMGGYDLATGKPLWWLRGGGDIPVPTPVTAGDLVFLTNGHGKAMPIYAIRLDARGDLTPKEFKADGRKVAWCVRRGGNYMPSPLVYRDRLYLCGDRATVSCRMPATGKVVYHAQLRKRRTAVTASLVAGDGKIYCTTERAGIHVLAAGDAFKRLAVNAVQGICLATPALAGETLLIRTHKELVAVREGATPPALPLTGLAAGKTLDGFKVPESIQADPDTGNIYVANINGSPGAKDGNGYISVLTPDGRLSKAALIGKPEGGGDLNAPKGLAIMDGMLYVADIDVVRRYALTSDCRALPAWPVPGAGFLNDLAIDDDWVYVSDTATGTVHAFHRATGKRREVARLASPNGLCRQGSKLYCVTWNGGRLFELDPAGVTKPKDITPSGNPFRGLDGLEGLADGSLLIADHAAGVIWRWRAGKVQVLAKGLDSPADFGLTRDRRTLLIPSFNGGRVLLRPLVMGKAAGPVRKGK